MKRKKPFRFYLANFVAKLATKFMKLLGRNATYFPGIIALKLDPNYIKHCEKPSTIIGITGTNGKTTTSNLINDYLIALNAKVTNNSLGSNTIHGIASNFVLSSTLNGKTKHDYAILEIDERSSAKIFAQLKPDYLVVTNLFRDSYARNAHADYIYSFLEEYIPDQTHLILNADDLISSSLKINNPRTYCSIDPIIGIQAEPDSRIKDLINCPICFTPLSPKYIFHNHIGQFQCSKCGFQNPISDYKLIEISLEDKFAKVKHNEEIADITLPSSNSVNMFNTVAAIACLNQCGYSLNDLSKLSNQVRVPLSRQEESKVGNKNVLSLLAKGNNPIATTRALKYTESLKGSKSIVLSNMTYLSDFSYIDNAWLYDNDYRTLLSPDFKQIICAGEKRFDFGLRVRLEGVDVNKIVYCEDLNNIENIVDYKCDNIILLHDIQNSNKFSEIYKNIIDRIESNKSQNI